MGKIAIDETITIFGGGGFIGSYIVKELAKTGARIKIVSRNPEQHSELKVCGAVGQVVPMYGNISDINDIGKHIKDSTYVINLVGILYERGKQKFRNIHSEAANNIAIACKKFKIKRLVHLSALGCDKAKTSRYACSKLDGEKQIMNNFSHSVILRPSVVFGPTDNFINLFARIIKISPIIPLIGEGGTMFQPVYVGDIAKFVTKVLESESKLVEGKVFELGGPEVITLRHINEMLCKILKKKRIFVSIPFGLAKFQAFFMQFLPKPLLTCDQVELLKYHNVLKGKNGLADFGIKPTALESIIPNYLQ